MPDRTPDGRRFDPRFDPAFQPGYDAGNDPVAAARGSAAHTPRFAETADVRANPALLMPTSTRPHGTPPAAAPPGGASVSLVGGSSAGGAIQSSAAIHGTASHEQGTESAGVGTTRSATADAGTLSLRNPFLIAIWVASAGFLLGGFALLRWLPVVSQQTQTSTGSNYDYLVVQSAVIGAPLLIVLGLTAAVGSMFLFAVRWRPRAKI